MNYKKITVNIITSGAQVLVIGVIYFFLYKYLLKQLGAEILGVWSVVLATSSLANLANFGVGSSVVRFVALYSDDDVSIRKLIFTSSMFLFLLFCGLSLIIYPFATLILRHVVGAKYVDLALTILPYSISCLIINEVAGVYASVLDGLQKNYIRSIFFTSSTVILFILAHLLTPSLGIKGVAIAQLSQCIFTFLCCLTTLIFIKKYNPMLLNWDKKILKEIFVYGVKFQFLSITGMLCDPVTKTLLAKFGGLSLAGYYEMALRLVNQVKGVIVNANQSLIPVIVNLSKDERSNANDFYRATMMIVFYVAIFVFSVVVLLSDQISVLWIGHKESFFSFSVLFLSISSFVNLLCNPAYFSSVASGKLNILIISQLLMAIGNIVFGLVGGHFLAGYGIVIGWASAGLIGSLYLILAYQQRQNIKFSSVISKEMGAFLLLICGIVVFQRYSRNYYDSIVTQLLFVLLICGISTGKLLFLFKRRNTLFKFTS